MLDDQPTDAETSFPSDMLGAIVLCGGQSTRLGIDKTELIFRGQTFLELVVRQVSKVARHVVLVGRINSESHHLAGNIISLQDERDGLGPLEGMRVGLKCLDDRNVPLAFVTSCDVPLLKPELIQFLISHRRKHSAIVPVDGARVYGMTAIYQTDLHSRIEARLENKQLRVSELADAFDARKVPVNELKDVDPNLDSMTNINSVKDYQALLDRFELTCPPELAKRIKKK